MANSADPDQLASSKTNWSGSTLFAKQGISGFSRTSVKPQHSDQNLAFFPLSPYKVKTDVLSLDNFFLFFVQNIIFLSWFVCVEVLLPSKSNEVMSSALSLPNHTFTGQA